MPHINICNSMEQLQSGVVLPSDPSQTKPFDEGLPLVSTIEVASSSASESVSDEDVDTFKAPIEPQASFEALEAIHAKVEAASVQNSRRLEIHVQTALKVLQVIETYGKHHNGVSDHWRGLSGYIPLVTEQIRAGQPVHLLFSGFAFKSPQALGEMPDLGEKLALAHLNGLCSNITAVYEPGAEVHISFDGLVYNDLLAISDETVWCYANALQEIARTSELQHLRFVQLGELLGHKSGVWTKKHTIQHASCLRRELLYKAAAAPGGFTSNIDGKDSPLQSYLTSRLPPVDDDVHNSVSSSLRARWYAYTSAIAATRADYIQITSYDVKPMQDCNALAISLLPQDERAVSLAPWDSVIVIETDGRYRSSTVGEVKDEEAYELVLDAAGSPSHYRAEADIWNWRADGLDVTFEHLYPTGTIIRPSSSYAGAAPSIQALPMHKVRIMAQRFSPVVLRGFRETTNEEYFLAKGNELGEILTWTFGQILKVKDSGEVDRNANNVTSNEAMPMHFDGIFKFVDTVDPVTGEVKKVLTPPRYQYFTCLSTAPKGDGYTLFANSRLFFQNLPAPFTLERLRKATWSMVNDGFWSAKQTELPLVVRHKETGAACLRWHQPWTETKFSKYFIEIENDEAAEELVNVINKLVYDYRVCLRFGWEQGDLLINDNVAMLHTRTAFSGACEREMWRIHFD